MARSNTVVAQARTASAQLMGALATLRELEREITANGGQAWIDAAALEGHPGITADEVIGAVFTTAPAIDALLAANGNAHAGNLYRLL